MAEACHLHAVVRRHREGRNLKLVERRRARDSRCQRCIRKEGTRRGGSARPHVEKRLPGGEPAPEGRPSHQKDKESELQ
jgi:hypothetical protein